jgi:uncharacterized protein
MTQKALIDNLLKCRPALEAEGATALYVYGSRARDDHRIDSDLDVFIDYDPAKKFSLFDLAGIKLVIEEHLGLETHVTTRDALFPRLRAVIEKQAIKVF